MGYELDQDMSRQERALWCEPREYYAEKVDYWLSTSAPQTSGPYWTPSSPRQRSIPHLVDVPPYCPIPLP